MATGQWVKHWGDDPDYPHYNSFNINIPKGFDVHGIDVSYAQGKIDWPQVASMQEEEIAINFAFIKASEGIMKVDPWFQRNWREAAKAGIVCGAYHFFRPRKDGIAQARFFLQTVPREQGDLPMVVDIETLDGVGETKMRKELSAFLRHLENKTGKKPIIYSGLSFYNDYLSGHFDDYRLWIAHYYKSKLNIASHSNWAFWQHSDKARINGINHVVDFNVFKGTKEEFRHFLSN